MTNSLERKKGLFTRWRQLRDNAPSLARELPTELTTLMEIDPQIIRDFKTNIIKRIRFFRTLQPTSPFVVNTQVLETMARINNADGAVLPVITATEDCRYSNLPARTHFSTRINDGTLTLDEQTIDTHTGVSTYKGTYERDGVTQEIEPTNAERLLAILGPIASLRHTYPEVDMQN